MPRKYHLTETGKKNRVSNFTDSGRKKAVENRKKAVSLRVEQRRHIVKRLHLQGLDPEAIRQKYNQMAATNERVTLRTIYRDLEALQAEVRK